MPANKGTIPPNLKRKVSPAMLWFTGAQGIFLRAMFIAVDAFWLYTASDHNGVLFLVGGCICPSGVAVLFSFVPFKPYRGIFYQRNVHEVDRSDPVVMRLVEVFRSNEARRQVWRQSLKLSVTLLAVTWSVAILFGGPLTWSFSLWSSRFWVFLIFCFVGCFTLLAGDHTDWALTTWASREVQHQSAQGVEQENFWH